MVYIKGTPYYLPERMMTNEELMKEFPEWSIDKMARKVGVNSRRLAAENGTTGDMAGKAARKLLKKYSVRPENIDFVMLCTQSPDHFLPPTACILQHRFGIPTSAGAFGFNLGCSGCVYGMALAKGIITAGVAKNVLLLMAETYIKYLHPSDKSNRAIFGDGAAVCLISTEGSAKIGEFSLGTDGSDVEKLVVRTGAVRCKDNAEKNEVDDGGHTRYDDHLYMNGNGVFNFTLETVPSMTKDVLEKNDTIADKVDYYIFHQVNKFMLNTIRKVCVLPKGKFYVSLEEIGNTVLSIVLIGLKNCLDSGTIREGMQVMVTGFGVGLSWGGTILQL